MRDAVIVNALDCRQQAENKGSINGLTQLTVSVDMNSPLDSCIDHWTVEPGTPLNFVFAILMVLNQFFAEIRRERRPNLENRNDRRTSGRQLSLTFGRQSSDNRFKPIRPAVNTL